MIDLGVFARDKVTGIEGIVTGRSEYIYGCTQYCIVPKAVDNKRMDGEWFDEGRIKVIGAGISATEVQVETPGGPNRDAPRGKF